MFRCSCLWRPSPNKRMAPSGQIFFAPFEFSFLYGSEVIFNLWDALALREVAPLYWDGGVG